MMTCKVWWRRLPGGGCGKGGGRNDKIPLFKVGTAAILPAAEALQFVGGIPKGWQLEPSKEGYGYDLVRRQFMVIIK